MLAFLWEAEHYLDCLQELVQLKLPKLGRHLKQLHCDMTIIATDWFLCLFSTVLPAEVSTPRDLLGLDLVVSVNLVETSLCTTVKKG